MSSKILVTGGNGQLGSELKKLLPDAIYTDVQELDITNLEEVLSFVKEKEIYTIINCAAYTAVDKAEDEEELAYKINAEGPLNLAKTGCKLIHVSTDYVFNGKGHTPYETNFETDPVSAYGRTKLAGEKAVSTNSKVFAIIRTAWLYSSYGNNFVKTMRRLGETKSEIGVISDQIGTPTFAGDLAEAIVAMLPQLNGSNSGVYHYTNEGVCSWYDFAHEIMELSNLNCYVKPLRTEEYPTKATRPSYSVLDKTSIKKTFNITIPHWKDSLKKCLLQF
ncbi:MAG: dTDP-4-dehydrorhamnose reductase [Succinivibrionaceae bacterium]